MKMVNSYGFASDGSEMEALKNVISSFSLARFSLSSRLCLLLSGGYIAIAIWVDDKKRFIKLLRLILLSSNFA